MRTSWGSCVSFLSLASAVATYWKMPVGNVRILSTWFVRIEMHKINRQEIELLESGTHYDVNSILHRVTFRYAFSSTDAALLAFHRALFYVKIWLFTTVCRVFHEARARESRNCLICRDLASNLEYKIEKKIFLF